MNKTKLFLKTMLAAVALGSITPATSAPVVVDNSGNTISAPAQQDKLERPAKQPGMERRVRKHAGGGDTRHLKTPKKNQRQYRKLWRQVPGSKKGR